MRFVDFLAYNSTNIFISFYNSNIKYCSPASEEEQYCFAIWHDSANKMKHLKTYQMSQQRVTFVESQTNLHKLPEQVWMLLNLLLKYFVQLEHILLCEDRGNHALKQFKIVSLSVLGFSLYEKYCYDNTENKCSNQMLFKALCLFNPPNYCMFLLVYNIKLRLK